MVPGSDADILQAIGILIAMMALGVVLWRSLERDERPEQEKSEERVLRQRTTRSGANTLPTSSPRASEGQRRRQSTAGAEDRGSTVFRRISPAARLRP